MSNTPELKPLEWKDGYRDAGCKITQVSPIPFYQIRELEGVVWLDIDNHQTIYPTVDAAKAAAQADYEIRIRAALQSAADTPPSPQTHLPPDVFSVHDGGNSITLHFAEIKSARTFRDTFPASIVTPAPEKPAPVGYAMTYGLEQLAKRKDYSCVPIQKLCGGLFVVPVFAGAPAPANNVAGDGEASIVECLAAGKPFVFDPATNFLHADDGTVEGGIRYQPAQSSLQGQFLPTEDGEFNGNEQNEPNEPVLYVSEKQLEQCIGTYLPTRKEAEGNFQLPLYRHPAPQMNLVGGDNQPRYTTKRMRDEIAKARAYERSECQSRITELEAALSLTPSPVSKKRVTAEEHNAAFDPANDAFGGAFKDGFREGWLFASDPGFDNREELEGDYHHVVDIAPAECWDAYREKYFAMLPLAAIPEVSE